MSPILAKNILLISGAFHHASYWEDWKTFFSVRGYKVLTPSWPFRNVDSETLRSRHPDPLTASVRLNTLIDFYGGIIEELSEPPILIGHSLGGLLVQLLQQRYTIAAGVIMNSIPPKGIFPLNFTYYATLLRARGIFSSQRGSLLMPIRLWRKVMVNGLSSDEQKSTYDKYAVPESNALLSDIFTAKARIDFTKPHVPLLFIAGGKDRFVPAAVNYRNYKGYTHKDSVTIYKEYDGNNHFFLQQQGWEISAEFIYNWLNQIP
ncbi:alpha/beta hydrolase [Robertkochia solimangrovi]|uniref:alpha/beta hydrolase n=1 Tax=Robertkochia solimangrovi TaxID=2213046 RepID=UPI00117DCF10|nr:alpha/beta hydrolase [Robertkochia solimangrovi]TRZ43562.1 alpha/beta hydrolase [Robertkochia solimangrovi]